MDRTVLAGKSHGGGAVVLVFRDHPYQPYVVYSVDADGNRFWGVYCDNSTDAHREYCDRMFGRG